MLHLLILRLRLAGEHERALGVVALEILDVTRNVRLSLRGRTRVPQDQQVQHQQVLLVQPDGLILP